MKFDPALVIWPIFFDPLVTVLTGFYCIYKDTQTLVTILCQFKKKKTWKRYFLSQLPLDLAKTKESNTEVTQAFPLEMVNIKLKLACESRHLFQLSYHPERHWLLQA